MIRPRTWLSSRLAVVAAGTVLAASSLVLGMGQVAPAAAQGPFQTPNYTYPLYNAAGQPTQGTVTALKQSSSTYFIGFTITLTGFAANTTYNIQGCATSPSLNVVHLPSCSAPSPKSVTTNPSGAVTQTVYFQNNQVPGVIDTITLTNSKLSSDTYRAVVAGVRAYLPVVGVGLPNYGSPQFTPVSVAAPIVCIFVAGSPFCP